MRSDPLRHGAHPTNDGRHEGTSRLDRSEHETTEPLNPIVGWSIVVLISLALWGGCLGDHLLIAIATLPSDQLTYRGPPNAAVNAPAGAGWSRATPVWAVWPAVVVRARSARIS